MTDEKFKITLSAFFPAIKFFESKDDAHSRNQKRNTAEVMMAAIDYCKKNGHCPTLSRKHSLI